MKLKLVVEVGIEGRTDAAETLRYIAEAIESGAVAGHCEDGGWSIEAKE